MAERWCKEHRQQWFKKGKMKRYAHPILDEDGEPTGEWCNEPKAEAKPESPASSESQMSKEDWAEKDRSQRISIETQVAVKSILELAKNGMEDSYFQKIYHDALRWCELRIAQGLPPASEKPRTEKPKEAPVGEGDSINELLQWVMEKMKHKKWTNPDTAHTWIVNVCKIPAERIESEPKKVKEEIAQLQGWEI